MKRLVLVRSLALLSARPGSSLSARATLQAAGTPFIVGRSTDTALIEHPFDKTS